MKRERLILLALTAFALMFAAEGAFAQGSHTTATLRDFWENPAQPSRPAPAAQPAPQVRKSPVKRAQSAPRIIRTSAVQPASSSSPVIRRSPTRSKASSSNKTVTPVNPAATMFNWSKAKNLDALKYDRDTTSGFLLSGNTNAGSVRIPTSTDTAGTLAVMLKSLGKGIAFFCGLFAMGLCWIGKAIASLFSRPSSVGARPGMETRNTGLSPLVAAGAFIVGVGIALVIPMPTPTLPAAAPEKPKDIAFAPWRSFEYRFHVGMPEKLEKEKHAESKSGMSIIYTVIGFRDPNNSKNEIAIGYAKLPDLQEMIRAKQRSEPWSTGNFNLYGQRTYYYFDVEKGLDGAVKAMKDQGKINVTYQCPLLLNRKLPGRELEGTAPGDRYIRSRVYCGYGNYYQMIVCGDREFVNSNDAYKFLDSFSPDDES